MPALVLNELAAHCHSPVDMQIGGPVMSRLPPVLRDIGLALGLAAALVVVYSLDRLHPDSDSEAPPLLTVAPVPAESQPPSLKKQRLAVTRGQYDDMGKLLQQLGEGYSYETLELTDLRDANKLSKFDVVFVTCGTQPESWVSNVVAQGDRPGTARASWNPAVVESLKNSLRAFVAKGGTLYASDFQRPLVELAFPEFIGDSTEDQGIEQELDARVVDNGLRDLIGQHLPLRFDMRGWFPASLSDPKATVYLDGEYQTVAGKVRRSPLLMKVPFQQGSIIFTSFHNGKQNSDKELQLLRYLVLTAVTAKIEATVAKTMVSGGFSPQKQNLLTASNRNPSVTQSYHHQNPGPLQFALGFADEGARMRLALVGPDSRKFEKEGSSTFTLSVPDAVSGDWTYTISAVDVPYKNFPFTLTVGAEGRKDIAAKPQETPTTREPRKASLPSVYQNRTLENRSMLVEKHGGSEATEKAVSDGLNWLARHQATDGSWSSRCLGSHGETRCEKGNACTGPGQPYAMAQTGLALLAFQGGGHYHFNQTQYSDAVRRGLDWLVQNQQPDGGLYGAGQNLSLQRMFGRARNQQPDGGLFRRAASSGYFMYEHGIATFALAEACAISIASRQPVDQRYLDAATKAVQFIERQQHTDGGWRYTSSPSEHSDTSVSGWQVLALKTAKNAEIPVEKECVAKIERFFASCEMGHDGRTGYLGQSQMTDATTGVGMLVHQFLLNSPKSPLVTQAARYLARRGPGQNDYYLWYNCTLAMFQAGGDEWKRWNAEVRDTLTGLQEHQGCARGSWPPNDPRGHTGGRIYSTALAVLTLEVYYRFTSQAE
jgi:Squalene-hopene cyclase C-terminal domain/Prenyltransferase and squalene oxidase repeat